MKSLKMFLLFILTYLLLIPFGLLVIFDRLVCSFWITKDIPGLFELKELDHEREAFARRYGLYVAVAIVLIILKVVLWVDQ